MPVRKLLKDIAGWGRDADFVDVQNRVLGDTEPKALPDTMFEVLSPCIGLGVHQRWDGRRNMQVRYHAACRALLLELVDAIARPC